MYALTIVICIIFACFVYYFFKVVKWIFCWSRWSPSVNDNASQGISVVIPFRNERRNFERNIHALVDQVEKIENVEVIFINDHSDDGGEVLISSLSNEKIKCVNATEYGKKRAVQQGVHAARHQYIVTLDADIIIGDYWLEGLLEATKSNVEFVILPLLVFHRKGLFQRFQYIEFLSLFAVTGASAIEGKPLMCNGAHLLFKKDFYLRNESRLRFDVSSGDDMFLMESLSSKDQWTYYLDSRVLVRMEPEESFLTFVRQRIRWAGKTKNLKSLYILIFGITVVLIQFSFWLFLALILFTEYSFGWFGILFLVKFLTDLFLIETASKKAGVSYSKLDVLLLSLCYPVYAFIIPLLSLFVVPRWKGRKISI